MELISYAFDDGILRLVLRPKANAKAQVDDRGVDGVWDVRWRWNVLVECEDGGWRVEMDE